MKTVDKKNLILKVLFGRKQNVVAHRMERLPQLAACERRLWRERR